MQPSKKVQQLLEESRKKRRGRAITWTVVGLFLAFMAFGILNEIDQARVDKIDDKKKAAYDSETVANDEEYIAWFEDHNKRFHDALSTYEGTIASQDTGSITQAKYDLQDTMAEATDYKVSDKSNFYYIHQDYIKAFDEFRAAVYQSGYSQENADRREIAKQMEFKVVADFIERKEKVDENH